MSFPEPARSVLEELQVRLVDLLGPNLVGLYVYGSLAFGCYNPARSDVDVLVVTRRRLAADTRRPIANFLRSVPRLEISFLSRPDLDPWRYPCPYDLHYSPSAGVKEDGEGIYFAGEIVNTRARGIALVGPPPQETLPEVPHEQYLDCIVRDIAWTRAHWDEAGPVYAVLGCSRVLAYARERSILSKAEAGEWALRELPARFHRLLERASQAYEREDRDDSAFDTAEVRGFMSWVEARL